MIKIGSNKMEKIIVEKTAYKFRGSDFSGKKNDVFIFLNGIFDKLESEGYTDLKISDTYEEGYVEYVIEGSIIETDDDYYFRISRENAAKKRLIEKDEYERLEYERLKAKYENK